MWTVRSAGVCSSSVFAAILKPATYGLAGVACQGRSCLTVTGSNARLQGLKVLVIDDSKTIRRTAET
ncbi:MAG: hypothetical protein ACRETG_04110, partial [Steroidobacteraceae bacterium]